MLLETWLLFWCLSSSGDFQLLAFGHITVVLSMSVVSRAVVSGCSVLQLRDAGLCLCPTCSTLVLAASLKACLVLAGFHRDKMQQLSHTPETDVWIKYFFFLCYKLLDMLSNSSLFYLLLVSERKPEGKLQAKSISIELHGYFNYYFWCEHKPGFPHLSFPVQLGAAYRPGLCPYSCVGNLHVCA